ncbi:NAD(P)/FAD-dependent oxidoreductase [Aerosakkonemataceae cyanobacterium BLCC-F154]|uniref:NAD(P)/FAD-dependent oxidoreductase n=1 Tax=Floridaenema fluviatile BLCC-F154 TaxID=3153640 RepID=A0ABV4Y685_9CYAN
MLDYDLVVIGGSPAGIYAAVKATNSNARVALVASPLLGSTWSESSSKYNKALSYMGKVARILDNAAVWGFSVPEQLNKSLEFGESLKWAKSIVSNLDENYSPAVLASLGVDVIFGEGEFCRYAPNFALAVKDQYLRSRKYLIATNSTPIVPEIEGLESAGYLTPDSIWQLANVELPKSLIVIGNDPVGVELAQTFSRLGCEVSLVVSSSRILAKEDEEAALLIQSQLEAEGIQVFTEYRVTQVRWLQGKKWIQAGNKAIDADEILIATEFQPDATNLNLDAVGVKYNSQGIIVNSKLQTTNRRIYACGDVLGGYRFPHIANYEAQIALKNLLRFPVSQVNYRYIPWAILSDPELARVGLTEAQAKRRYSQVLVTRRYFKMVDKAQIRGEITGFCKIITLSNGEILGAHIVGAEASELIHVFALAMQQKLKVQAIANLTPIFPTLSEINCLTAADCQDFSQFSKIQPNFWEGFLNLVRSWFN